MSISQPVSSKISYVMSEEISFSKILSQNEIVCKITCFIRVSNYILLGTSIGTVLSFECPVLKLISELGRKGFSNKLGSVSSLDYFSPLKQNLTPLLLVGHARGPITLWDFSNKKCLYMCSDVVTEGSSILLARFSSNPNIVCILDSFGNVCTVVFKNVFGIHAFESFSFSSFLNIDLKQCILNFSFFRYLLNANFNKFGLIVFATSNSLFLSITSPKPKCLTEISLCEDTQLLPLIAWKPQTNEFEDVLLAIGYNKNIRVLLIFLDHTINSIGYSEIDIFNLFHEIVSLDWLGQSVLGILDPGESFHIYDTKLKQELQMLDLSHISLIYGSQFFKSYEAGGRPHPLFDIAGRHACFNSVSFSISCDQFKVNFLGLNSIISYYLPHWKSQIDTLVGEYRISDALELARGFVDGTAGEAIGLSQNKEERKMQTRQTIYRLVLVYVELSLKGDDSLKSNEFDPLCIKLIAKYSIECCLVSGLSNEIFGELFEKFVECGKYHVSLFYEIVGDFIIEREFPPLLATFANSLIENIVENGQGCKLEKILPRLKVEGDIDIQHLIQISAINNLYGLLIYTYSSLLADYVTPIRILVETLYIKILDVGETGALSVQMESMGYKLLVYINSCLTGKSYCNDNLSSVMAKLAKDDTFSLLLSPDSSGLISTANPYPYLRIFLLFNYKDFFNILTIVFNEENDHTSILPRNLVDAFLIVLFGETDFTLKRFVDAHYFSLLSFISNLNNLLFNKISLSLDVFLTMLNLIKHSSSISHFDKEHLFLELMISKTIPEQFSLNSMLVWALEGRFYQVCERIYISRRQYVEVLQCYWNEPLRTPQAFRLIHLALNGNDLSPLERDDIITEIIRKICILVHISARHTAELVLLYFPIEIDNIVKLQLRESSLLQFEFLSNIICLQNSEKSDILHLTIDVQDIYIELLAKYQPQDVLSFLHQTDQFRIEHVLDVAKKYSLKESSAFLHERLNQYDEAFTILLSNLKEELLKIPTTVETLLNKLSLVMGLLERATRSLNESQKESFWFQLLDSISDTNPELSHSVQLELIRTLLKSFNAHVSLPALFQKITNDNFPNSVILNDFRVMMLNMLAGCTYQVNTLYTVYSIIIRDLESNFKSLRCFSNKAVGSKSFKCELCDTLHFLNPKKSSSTDDLIIFNCSHVAHTECERDWLLKNGSEFHSYSCPTCNEKSRRASSHIPDKGLEYPQENKTFCLSNNQKKALASIKSIFFST